jgi:hypothetical protein
VGVGVVVTVGVCVVVGVALNVGILDGDRVLGEFVACTFSIPVTANCCGSSGGDPEQAAKSVARNRMDTQNVRDLRIIRITNTCKRYGYEI